MKKTFLLILFFFISVFAYNQSMAQDVNFFSLSDIHFDPYLYCGTEKNCALIEKLRRAPVSNWDKILSPYRDAPPAQYHHDTNYALLLSSLAAAKKVAEENQIQFTFLLGDLLGHDYKVYFRRYSQDKSDAAYKEFARKTLSFLTQKLVTAFPTTDVYLVAGNNDSYQYDYTSTPNGPFFADTAITWSSLIKNPKNRASMQNQFKHAGYYAIDLPNLKIKLIALNTNLFSYKARGKGVPEAALQELNWLHNQLQQVKEHQQKAFILMHIPDGIDIYKSPRLHLFRILQLWRSNYIDKFKNEISQFSPQISAIFAGHLHSDWFHILTFDVDNKEQEVPFFGTPSISPVFGNNPGFKVYTYSVTHERLEDYVAYYYPVSGKRSWDVAYGINQIYKPDCYVCPTEDKEDAIKESASLAAVHKIITTPKQTNPSLWRPAYWCAVFTEEDMSATKCGNA